MPVRLLAVVLAAVFLSVGARAQSADAWYPLKGDDGTAVANYRVPVELESEIEALPGIVVVGNPHGDVTLAEFYDLNCPYCRKAAPDIAALLHADKELRLVLVPFPVLGVASIQAGRVELALAGLASADKFYDFHRRIYASRGVVDAARALAVAKELGFAAARLTEAGDSDAVTQAMLAHVRLGNALGLTATPAFVIKATAILGHPGRNALAGIIAAVRKCDRVSC